MHRYQKMEVTKLKYFDFGKGSSEVIMKRVARSINTFFKSWTSVEERELGNNNWVEFGLIIASSSPSVAYSIYFFRFRGAVNPNYGYSSYTRHFCGLGICVVDPDPHVCGLLGSGSVIICTDPDPSIKKQKSKKNL